MTARKFSYGERLRLFLASGISLVPGFGGGIPWVKDPDAMSDAPGKGRVGFGEIALANTFDRMFADPKAIFVKYNPSAIASRKGIDIYTAMMRDDQVKAALALKRYAVLGPGWQIQSPKDSPEDWPVQQFVEDMLVDLPNTLDVALDEILSSFGYGFSVTEKVWEMKPWAEDGKDYIQLADLKTRHPRNLWFLVDGFGNINALKQINELMPPEKFIVYSHDGKFSNPYGESDLDAAYQAWWIKNNTYKWLAMFLERQGIPPVFALYDSSFSGFVDELKKVLQNLQAATVGAIPRGASKDSLEMWSPDLADNVQRLFEPALKQFNEDIARAILIPNMMGLTPEGSGGGKGLGSQARAVTHFDIFMFIIERIRSRLKAKVNREIVRPVCDYNYAGLKMYPEFELLPLTDDTKMELFATWQKLVDGGTVRPQVEDEIHIRELLSFPEIDQTPMPYIEPTTVEWIDADGNIVAAGTPDATPQVAPGSKPPPASAAPDKGDKNKKTAKLSAYATRKVVRHTIEQARKIMDTAEVEMARRMQAAITESRDVLIAAVKKTAPVTIKFIGTVQLRKMGEVQSAAEEGLRAAWNGGSAMRYVFTPKQAVAYMKQKALNISGVVRDDLTAKAKQVLVNAVADGSPIADTTAKLKEVFDPYIGGDPHLADAAKPSRLMTIIRTNVTDAYNQGRLGMAKDPDIIGGMAGMRYSAVMDERTTDLCEFLDDKLFGIEDPALEQLAPPNHFNCRSILVPVTKGEAEDEGLSSNDFIGAADVGTALQMKGSFEVCAHIHEYDQES